MHDTILRVRGPFQQTARSQHPGGVHMAYCDGHIEFTNDGIDMRLYRAIATRAGGRRRKYSAGRWKYTAAAATVVSSDVTDYYANERGGEIGMGKTDTGVRFGWSCCCGRVRGQKR